MIKFLLIIFIVIILAGLILIKPRISIGGDHTIISLPKAVFYISSKGALKVYKFNPQPKELEDIIESNTKDKDATFGIYIKNISTGQETSLNADQKFSAASLYKLAVMYTIYKKGSMGELNISDPKIQSNLRAMITVSSNEASLYLVENYTSWSEITKNMQDLGLKDTNLNKNPTVTTPGDMGKLLELMALGKLIDLETSTTMLELMLAQKVNDRIPVNLPPNTLVAHKTGELDDVRHDAGVIVSPENNYILVLMSKDSDNPESVKPVMAKLSSEVYEFFIKQWANPPEIL